MELDDIHPVTRLPGFTPPPISHARRAVALPLDSGRRRDDLVMWPQTPEALIEAQLALAAAAPPVWLPPQGDAAIGACVVVFPRKQTGPGAAGDTACAASAVLREGLVLAQATIRGEAGAPYAPGLLALREGPILETVVRALDVAPDVLLVDATGRDHPRGAGLALQLGAVVGLPTVGVTHRPLLAEGVWPADIRGARSSLLLDGRHVATWVRTRPGVRPLAIHPGWRTDTEVAVEIALKATRAHRTPEPFRHARRLARTARAQG
jgi:deoxyribonuclease V